MNQRALILIGAGAALVLVIAAAWAARNARMLGAGAVGVASDVTAGAVEGLGDLVGIPRTNESECARALAEGRWWDASFACAAPDFLRGIFSGQPAQMLESHPTTAP